VRQVYRLVRTDRSYDVLAGEGARLYGGRWNPPGYPVVYVSESRALAVLEAFVHLVLEAREMRFLLYAITLPRGVRMERYGSHPRSRRTRASVSSREVGRAWLDAGETLALIVPSVIVPQETNYVLNARHPRFADVRVVHAEAFSFDDRLWKHRSGGA
jgi:RES domain-containing protein